MAPTAPDDPLAALDALRARVDAAQQAAERLAAQVEAGNGGGAAAGDGLGAGAGTDDAGAGADAGGRPGAAAPGDIPRATQEAASEVQALAALVEMLRDLLPPDLRAQLTEVVRQLLLLVRAALDWWVARLEPRAAPAPPAAPEVQDIPVT